MRNCFAESQSFHQIESTLTNVNTNFKDPSALGVFISNHDNPRFLNFNNNAKRIKAATAFSFMTSNYIIMINK